MTRYLIRRLLVAVLLVAVAASAAFVLARLAPGIDEDNPLSPVDQQLWRARRGLDRPLLAHYLSWLGGVARLDLGVSALYSRPVRDLVGERALNTAILATSALALATLLGVPLGVYSGSRRAGAGRAVVRLVSLVCLSVPPLVGSLLLVLVAARTGWLPVGGMTSAGTDASWLAWWLDVLRHLPLPALALALPLAATLERLQAQSLAAALAASFVAASRARGVDRARMMWRHAWPASLRPVVAMYGAMVGALFSGSFVVEVVTAWPGLGRLMFDALLARDLFLVAGTAAMGAACLAVATFAADAALAVLDPRVAELRA